MAEHLLLSDRLVNCDTHIYLASENNRSGKSRRFVLRSPAGHLPATSESWAKRRRPHASPQHFENYEGPSVVVFPSAWRCQLWSKQLNKLLRSGSGPTTGFTASFVAAVVEV